MIRKSIILSLTSALLVLSPTGLAFAQGGGGGGGGGGAGAGSAGGGTGAAGMGSAAVGGGAPAGSVGGGPPAGRVGGGAPGSNDPAGNGAAGTGYPSLNAAGQRVVPPSNPAAGLENAPTAGGVIGGNSGVPAGGISPTSPRSQGRRRPIPRRQAGLNTWQSSPRPQRLAARCLDQMAFLQGSSRPDRAVPPLTKLTARPPAWGSRLGGKERAVWIGLIRPSSVFAFPSGEACARCRTL
jgi:hypothetical protein